MIWSQTHALSRPLWTVGRVAAVSVLAAALLTAVGSPAGAVGRHPWRTPQHLPPVAVRNAPVSKPPVNRAAVMAAAAPTVAAPTWPTPASGTVNLSVTRPDAQDSVTRMAGSTPARTLMVGGLPLRLGPTTGAPAVGTVRVD